MAEGEGLEPSRPKPPVFKTGALPIMLTLRIKRPCDIVRVRKPKCPVTHITHRKHTVKPDMHQLDNNE